jgi:thioester reductase-like protein
LLKIFLQNGHKVYALARDKGNLSAQERVKNCLSFWDGKLSVKDLVVLKGDITKKDLGLDVQTVGKLQEEIEEIYHFAAVINFNWLLTPIRLVNVSGTQTVLDFAQNCRNKGRLVKVNHISTAYIYGSYQGAFKENSLDVGQKFTNTYEQSKFEAEKIAHQYRQKGLWIDIFRPPIVIGHSKTGRIMRFNNIYQLVGLCSLNLFETLPILSAKIWIAPVDLVTEAIYLISQRAPERNKTYHVFPAEPVSVEKIMECGCALLKGKTTRPVALADFNLKKLTPAQRAILKNNILAINFKNQLNSDYTCGLLESYSFTFPELEEKALSRILEYFAERQGRA